MLKLLGKFDKQPTEVLDYNFDLTAWLAAKADTIASFTVIAEPGVTVVSTSRVAGVIKVFIGSGVDGSSYKVTCTAVTAGGRTKQGEIEINVTEI